jgi:uncharacterized protein YbgA (DUF1722 family)/uncharacterized protein YbbK (DUF523 family)
VGRDWRDPELDVVLGVSSCLLGEEVRYDGGHQKDDFVTGLLARYVRFVSVCPEMAIGLGAPRETLQLVGDPAAPRLVAARSGIDHTSAMTRFAAARIRELGDAGIHGYILKRASPSCGMERVKVYAETGVPGKPGRGLFAAALLRSNPLLPVEEEGRLADPWLRESFVTRIFAYRRLAALREARASRGEIASFHTAHKSLLLAHSPAGYAALGRMVAGLAKTARGAWLTRYAEGFMGALRTLPTTKKHVNVLQHIAGFFERKLDGAATRELGGLIEDYARGRVPLVVPVTLINHFAARVDVPYVRDQVYLRPHPKELMLRNHV